MVAHIPDVDADREYALPQTATIGNMRALLAVPLLRKDEVVGTITLGRSTTRVESDVRPAERDQTPRAANQSLRPVKLVRIAVLQRTAFPDQTS